MSAIDMSFTDRYVYTFGALATAIAAYICYEIAATFYNAFFGPLSTIPGPLIRRFTIMPHAYAVARGRQHLDMMDLHERYGPVVRFGPKHVIFLGNQQTTKAIYGFRKGGAIPKDHLFYGMTVNGAHSVATASTADHGRQRKIFSNAFSDRALKQQEPIIKQYAKLLTQKLQEQALDGSTIDLVLYYNAATFDVMADLTFGEPLGMLEGSQYTPWVRTIFEGVRGATILRSFKHLGYPASYLVDEIIFKTKYVRERMLEHWNYSARRVDRRLARKETDRPDIWTLVQGKEREHGGLSLEEHHANGNVFMIAGTETTATLLSGATFFLLKNPACMRELSTEIRDSVANFNDLSLEGLARLKYLNAVLNEALRLYPPAPIDLPREVDAEGVVIGDKFLPAGTKTGVSNFATFRSKVHFKHAEAFRPERWLDHPDYASDDLGSVEPFSVGPRNCLGKNLAWHEMRLLLATVILQFDIELCPQSSSWDDQRVFTLWEKQPLWVRLAKVNI